MIRWNLVFIGARLWGTSSNTTKFSSLIWQMFRFSHYPSRLGQEGSLLTVVTQRAGDGHINIHGEGKVLLEPLFIGDMIPPLPISLARACHTSTNA